MALSRSARVVAVVAARHDVADARLLVAVVVVVGGEDGAEAIDARLVLVAEVMGDQFEVLAVQVAAPDGAGPAIGVVARPFPALAGAALEGLHALAAARAIE